MGDPHGLVELSLYWIAVALALPLLDGLVDQFPALGITLAVLLLLPAPFWIAGLWFSIPERLELLVIWHSMLTWAVLGIVLVVALGLGIAAWLA